MNVRPVDDPASFLASAEPLLLADEARHNLMLGLTRTLIDRPDACSSKLLWLVEDGDRVVGAALRTPPRQLVLARPETPEVLEALVRSFARDGAETPGVIGGVPEAPGFATLYADAFGLPGFSTMEQGIYALRKVESVPTPSGTARPARADDANLLLPWLRDFIQEAAPDETWDEERARTRLGERIASAGPAGMWVWDDGGAVSLSGHGGPTPNGIRVGPVYTPPERRGRGYATALVAAQSAWLLRTGRRFCFLYTDMANPTSNAIYRRIGYRLECESAQIRFTTRD